MKPRGRLFPGGIAFFTRGIAFFPGGIAFFPDGIAFFPGGIAFFPDGIAFFATAIALFVRGIAFFTTAIALFTRGIAFFSTAIGLFTRGIAFFAPAIASLVVGSAFFATAIASLVVGSAFSFTLSALPAELNPISTASIPFSLAAIPRTAPANATSPPHRARPGQELRLLMELCGPLIQAPGDIDLSRGRQASLPGSRTVPTTQSRPHKAAPWRTSGCAHEGRQGDCRVACDVDQAMHQLARRAAAHSDADASGSNH